MKTMLDKCAVAGDITQAIDRRGAWTCAIVIAGGTESTAVKLQSCDTADGSFSDFKTLIPASEAEADQYKGFVIDLDGAKKFIKVTGATMATCVKQVAIKTGEIPSGADLENNKTATIDVSTYTEPVEIEPTEGKDGMKKATVTLSNIPSGGSGESGFIITMANGDSDGNWYTTVIPFGSAELTPNNRIPSGNYKGYFASADTTDWQTPANLFSGAISESQTTDVNNVTVWNITLNSDTSLANSGAYETQGKTVVLVLIEQE